MICLKGELSELRRLTEWEFPCWVIRKKFKFCTTQVCKLQHLQIISSSQTWKNLNIQMKNLSSVLTKKNYNFLIVQKLNMKKLK